MQSFHEWLEIRDPQFMIEGWGKNAIDSIGSFGKWWDDWSGIVGRLARKIQHLGLAGTIALSGGGDRHLPDISMMTSSRGMVNKADDENNGIIRKMLNQIIATTPLKGDIEDGEDWNPDEEERRKKEAIRQALELAKTPATAVQPLIPPKVLQKLSKKKLRRLRGGPAPQDMNHP